VFDVRPMPRAGSRARGAIAASLVAVGSLLAIAPAALAAGLTFSWAHPRPQGNSVNDFEVVDDANCFAVGNRGVVLKTTDGGTTWSLVSDINEISADLHAVRRLANGDLLAAGSAPGLFRSTDEGASWTEVPNPSTGTLRCLDLAPSGRLDAAGDEGVAIRSTDGGLTWSSMGPGVGSINAQHWASDLSGWVVGRDVAHHTTDGGESWTQAVDLDFFGFRDIYFSEPHRGFITADFGYWETLDGGATWTHVDLFTSPLYRRATLVLDPQHWLVINSGEGAELFETTDGGSTWHMLHFKWTLGFQDIARLPGGRVLISSTCGDLFYSDDLGQTLTNAAENLDGDQPGPIYRMGRAPDGRLYAANNLSTGDDETWLESQDGGLSWTRPETPPILPVAEMYFPRNDLGLVASYEAIQRSTDRGASWNAVVLPNDHRAGAFSGSETFYVATHRTSGGGSVFRSTDDGVTWEPRGTGLGSTFQAWGLHFVDDANGVVCGYSSSGDPAMYRTTNGGGSWTAMSTAGLPGFAVTTYWHNAQNGLVASHNWGICRTTNGGASWTQVSAVRTSMLSFRDPSNGVASTSSWNGELQRTTDGGATWESVPVPMDDMVTCAIMTDTGIVIGGTETRLMHALESDPAGTPPGEMPAAAPWALSAYPNPTTGSTTLSWTAGAVDDPRGAKATRVTLHASDGRLVRTLEANEGNGREARWDGRDEAGRHVAAGVYWARVTGGGGAVAKRVVVVR